MIVWGGAVAGVDEGEDAEGEQHGDDHGGVAHPPRLLPRPQLPPPGPVRHGGQTPYPKISA